MDHLIKIIKISHGRDDLRAAFLETVKAITKDELIEIGIKKIGHRKKILICAKKLNINNNDQNYNEPQNNYQNDAVEGVNFVDTAR